jgi:hypothetical protein
LYRFALCEHALGSYNDGMEREKKAEDAEAVLFKRVYGVKPDTFGKMLAILQKEYDTLHQKGDRAPKLTAEDKLYITLK